MTRWPQTVITCMIIGVAAWLSFGLEVTNIDHETRYLPFVKSYPSTTIIFRSYMGCDECDAPNFSTLSTDQQVAFTEFCRAKYGFDEPRVCSAIYAEQRKIGVGRIGAPKK